MKSPLHPPTLHGRGNGQVPYIASVFVVVPDAGLSTALYASKRKFVLFDRSWGAEHGAATRSPPTTAPTRSNATCASGAAGPTGRPS